MNTRKVAVVGAGSIGCGLAVTFATAGFTVALHDTVPRILADVDRQIAERIAVLEETGLIDPDQTRVPRGPVTGEIDLGRALEHAAIVFECVPENADLKTAVIGDLLTHTGEDTVVASVTSAFTPAAIAAGLPMHHRFLVTHPVNPPYVIPIVEVVPGDFTASDIVAKTVGLLTSAGLTPIEEHGAALGFVYNRLQGAVLREAYCLVRDGVCSTTAIDTLVRRGLGLRWAVCGPFETVDLNTHGGIREHARRMGPAYAQMGRERGQDDPWTPELVDRVERERRELLPLTEWEERNRWRARSVARLRRLLDSPEFR